MPDANTKPKQDTKPPVNLKCTFNLTDEPCPNKATWINSEGVSVCDYHKLLLDGFSYELRGFITWNKIGGDM